MPNANRYFRRSKLHERKFLQLLELFSRDVNATNAAEGLGLSRRSVTDIYLRIRRRITEACEIDKPRLSGGVYVGQHFFGPRNVTGLPGRASGKKLICLGFMDSAERVRTTCIPDCAKLTLHAAIIKRIRRGAVVTTDRWRGYEGIGEAGGYKHFRIAKINWWRHFRGEGKPNLNLFWFYVENRLGSLFRGVPLETLELHLKECEFRWNHRDEDLYQVVERILGENPL